MVTIQKVEFSYMTIEPDKRGEGVNVYGHSTYPASSVLAGQPRKVFLDGFPDTNSALEKYPTAKVQRYITVYDNSVGSCPAPWFDESDAGECWDDDY